MPNMPLAVVSVMLAEGGCAPLSLLEIQLLSGIRLYVSDGNVSALSLLSTFDSFISTGHGGAPIGGGPSLPTPTGGPAVVAFAPRLTDPPQFALTGTLVTPTANASFENFSGDTVRRAGSLQFSQDEFWGALFVYRLWMPVAAYALMTMYGNVLDADVDEKNVNLSLRGSNNWSDITAPDCTIGPSCQNTFGSLQCGSQSPTPCTNTYGTCSQINRFKGLVTTWDSSFGVGDAPSVAQPAPVVSNNQRKVG